jgi:rfaE bifunctional protein kinase chain/domain
MLIDKLRDVQSSNKKPSILVIGDLMIDHYIIGEASRLSPEAPVPVVSVKNDTLTLGGAGNVVKNLTSLGANVCAAGITGDDDYGKQMLDILKQENALTNAVISDSSRTTTIKTRVLVGSHQMLRIDREVTDCINAETADKLLKEIEAFINKADLVILSDYNKGLFSPVLTQSIIAIANKLNKKVVVDPKGLCYSKYKGSYIIKPNRKELAQAANMERITSTEDLKEAAKLVLMQTDSEYLVVTLSEDGMAILSKDSYQLLPVKASNVFDVTGAGDTALATMAYFIALGFDVDEACEIANNAAAIVIQQVGSATTNINEIINYMIKN